MQVSAEKIAVNISFEEYLKREEQAESKSEFHGGEVFAMAGGTLNHSLVSGNMRTSISNSLASKGKTCFVFESNAKVFIEAYDKGLYPDVSVVCGKPELHLDNATVYKNPQLIIEVLSPSTEAYDRGAKFAYYRSVLSFQEYVLVSTEVIRVESWFKQEQDLWRISSAEKLDQSIHLFSLDIDINLEDIYRLIQF